MKLLVHWLERHGSAKKSLFQISKSSKEEKMLKKNKKRKMLLPKKKNNNKPKSKRNKNLQLLILKLFLQPKRRRRTLLMSFPSQPSILMISKEISSMLLIELKLTKDFGLHMTLKDGVFGEQTINFMKVKEKLDT